MTELQVKSALFVGESHPILKSCAEFLTTKSIEVSNIKDLNSTTKDKFDLLFLNFLQDTDLCNKFLQTNQRYLYNTQAIFALVAPTPTAIEAVLMVGVTDYFVPNEKPDSLIKKIQSTVLGSEMSSNNKILNISEPPVQVKKSGVRVFLIEDDPLLLDLLATWFKKVAFSFVHASNSKDILAVINKYHPHVIVLDLTLPDKDGLQILSEIKATPTLKNIPVVVFSNRDSDEDHAKATALGAERFFVKATTDLSKLMLIIEDLAP